MGLARSYLEALRPVGEVMQPAAAGSYRSSDCCCCSGRSGATCHTVDLDASGMITLEISIKLCSALFRGGELTFCSLSCIGSDMLRRLSKF
jgi:hypothetical protein